MWDVETWHERRRFSDASCFFSPDGKMLALNDALGVIRLVEPDTGREVVRLTGPEPTWYSPACFSPDGTRLVATVLGSKALYVWDLHLIRRQLQDLGLGLDWDWPPFPPAPEQQPERLPPEVTVDLGFLGAPLFSDDRLAVAVLSLSLAHQPFNYETSLQRGLAYRRLGDARRAIEDYERFLALAPPDDDRRPEILVRRANSYARLSDQAATAAALKDLLEVSLDQVPWPAVLANLCNGAAWHHVVAPPKSPVSDMVLALAEKAVEIEPFNGSYQTTRGAVLYRLGRWHDAVRRLEANLRDWREGTGFDLYLLAMSYQRLGQPDKAKACFERADAWCRAQSNLSRTDQVELAVFRAEAAALLGVAVPSP